MKRAEGMDLSDDSWLLFMALVCCGGELPYTLRTTPGNSVGRRRLSFSFSVDKGQHWPQPMAKMRRGLDQPFLNVMADTIPLDLCCHFFLLRKPDGGEIGGASVRSFNGRKKVEAWSGSYVPWPRYKSLQNPERDLVAPSPLFGASSGPW